MTAKTKNTSLIIWLIIICMTNFGEFYKYLPLGSAIYSTDYMLLSCFLLSLCLLIFALVNNNGKLKKGEYFIIVWYLVVLVLVELVVTYVNYHQPIALTIKESFYYLVPATAYLAFVQWKQMLNIKRFYNILISASIICSTIAIFAFVLYTYMGLNILRLSTSSVSDFRNGTIRFAVGGIVVYVAMTFSIGRLLAREYTKKDIVNICLGTIQLVFINKTRANIMYFIVVVLITILLNKKVKKTYRALAISGLVISGLVALFTADSISQNVNLFISGDIGVMARIEAIDFYMKQFLDKPLLGMGLLSGNQSANDWQLVSGYNSAYYYYRDDVGVVGLINKFGIVGVIWVVYFFSKVAKNLKRANKISYTSGCKSLLIYMMVSIISLNFMDAQRVMYIFILLICSELCLKNVELDRISRDGERKIWTLR